MLGFNVKFVSPGDGAWGNDIGNNTFNGMVGMVQRYVKILKHLKEMANTEFYI